MSQGAQCRGCRRIYLEPVHVAARMGAVAAGAGGQHFIAQGAPLHIETRESMNAAPKKTLNAHAMQGLGQDTENEQMEKEIRELRRELYEKGEIESAGHAEPSTIKKENEKFIVEERVRRPATAAAPEIKPAPSKPEIKAEPEKMETAMGKIFGQEKKPQMRPAQVKGEKAFAEPPRPIEGKQALFSGFFAKKEKKAAVEITPEKASAAQKISAEPPNKAIEGLGEFAQKKKTMPFGVVEMPAQKIAARNTDARENAMREIEEAERESEIIGREIERVTALQNIKRFGGGPQVQKPRAAIGNVFGGIVNMFSPKKTPEDSGRKDEWRTGKNLFEIKKPEDKIAKRLEELAKKRSKRGTSPLQFEVDELKSVEPSPLPEQKRGARERARIGKVWAGQKVLAGGAEPKEGPQPLPPENPIEVRGEMSEQRIARLKARLAELEAQKERATEAIAKGAEFGPSTLTLDSNLEMAKEQAPSRDVRKFTEDVLKTLERKTTGKSRFVSSQEQQRRELESSKQYIRESMKEAGIKEGITIEDEGNPQKGANEPEQAAASGALPKSAMLLRQLLKEESA